jgi:hypothetical protein
MARPGVSQPGGATVRGLKDVPKRSLRKAVRRPRRLAKEKKTRQKCFYSMLIQIQSSMTRACCYSLRQNKGRATADV